MGAGIAALRLIAGFVRSNKMLRFKVRIWLCGVALAVHAIVLFGTASNAAAGEDSGSSGNVLVVQKQTSVLVVPKQTSIPAVARQTTIVAVPKRTAARNVSNNGRARARAAYPPSARTMSLELPLKYRNFYLGDVPVKIGPGSDIAVKMSSLAAPLKKIMKPQALAALLAAGQRGSENAPPPQIQGGVIEVAKRAEGSASSAMLSHLLPVTHEQGEAITPAPPSSNASVAGAATSNDYLPLAEINKRGLDLRYNALTSELTATPTIGQQLDSDLSAGSGSEATVSSNAQQPAFVSAYVNLRMVMDYVSQSAATETGVKAPAFDIENAIRIGPLVLENEAALIPRSASNFSDVPGYDLVRRGSRLIYDSPASVIRYKAGDISPGFSGFQASPDLLGLSAERSYAQLRPGQNIKPAGQHSFRIERPSNVDILIDGAVFRRLRLQPGSYNINDLPLKPGATKITLVIEDDTGARRTLEFTHFGGQDLLAPGIDEWQIAAGVEANNLAAAAPSLSRNPFAYREPGYLWNEPAITGFYRRGLTQQVTAGAQLQADSRAAMAGGTVATQTPYGYVAVDLSGSFEAVKGPGLAARAAYELFGVRDADNRSQSFRFAAEYQSAAFTTLANYASPQDHSISLSTLYSRDLSEDLSASLSGTVYLARDPSFATAKWDTDLTFSQRFSGGLSGAFSFGYGEGGQRIAADAGCVCQTAAGGQGFRAFLRLSYRPDANSTITLAYDTPTQTPRATYAQSASSGGDAWSALLDSAYSVQGRAADIAAGASYAGNRGEIALNHAARLEGLSQSGADARSTSERTSLRLETGIAMADGAFSFGRPIRNSFAIVETHETLGGRYVSLGGKDKEIGHSDWLAPALVSDISSYAQRRVEFDVDNLPAGYDLGAGAFDFYSPYKAGYRVRAGSAYTITAMGTLIGEDGKPASLLAGSAREVDRKDGPEVQLFTNKAGRFGAQGLAAGRWIVELATEPQPTRYVIEIPDGTSGMHNAGTLKPARL
jgi:outer membrane usher protein